MTQLSSPGLHRRAPRRRGRLAVSILAVATTVFALAVPAAASAASDDVNLRDTVTAVTGSGPNPSGEGPQKALDADAGTKWLSQSAPSAQNPGWLQYDLGAAASVSSYSLTAANDASERDPRDFQVQGSVDGTTWTTVDSRSDVTLGGRGESTTFTLAAPSTAYTHFRLSITANRGADSVQLADWQIFRPATPPRRHPRSATR